MRAKIIDPDKFSFRADYTFDFIPDVGIVKIPALFIEERPKDIFYLNPDVVDVILKDQLIFQDDYYVANQSGQSIKLDSETYQELVSAKREILSPEAVKDYYYQLRYSRNKFQFSPNFKKLTYDYLALTPVFGFDGKRLTVSIKPIVPWGKREGEIVDIAPQEFKKSDFVVRGYAIYQAHNNKARLERITKKLNELHFKKHSQNLFILGDPTVTIDLLWKLKKQRTIKGMLFQIDSSLKSLSLISGSIEPRVSVKLDAGKSLVYLDVDYYHKRLKVDPAKIKEVLDSAQSIIKIGNKLLTIDYKKIQTINNLLNNKKILPLEKFYLAFEITRLVQRVSFTDSYKNFFRDLSKLNTLPIQKLPRQLRKEINVYRYQILGFYWLSFLAKKKLNGILADEMGLGKTFQALLTIFASTNFRKGTNIIVCPKSLVENWRNEIEHFFHFRGVKIHYGNKRVKYLNNKDWIGKIMITTYDVARLDFKKFLKLNINYLVLDEAQKIKNPDAQVTKALKIINAQHKIALTGTPLENRLSELWSIFDFLMPGFWGTQTEFRKRYEIPIVEHQDKQALNELRTISRPLILRRKINDVFKLPSLRLKMKSCDLYEEQLSLYKNLINDPYTQKLVTDIKNDKVKPNSVRIIVLLQKLRMVCSHPDLITKEGKDGKRSGKMELLFQVLKDLLADKKNSIIVFIEFLRNFAFIEHWGLGLMR